MKKLDYNRRGFLIITAIIVVIAIMTSILSGCHNEKSAKEESNIIQDCEESVITDSTETTKKVTTNVNTTTKKEDSTVATTTIETTTKEEITTEVPKICEEEATTPTLERNVGTKAVPLSNTVSTPSTPTSNESYSHYINGVPGECQLPQLPTGCEATALTNLLNYYGMGADKWQMAMGYMPRLDFYTVNGALYGADYNTTFAGNPSLNSGYGCNVPCLIKTANNFLAAKGLTSKYRPVNLTGTNLTTLLTKYVANNVPILVISTQSLLSPYVGKTWTTPGGYQVTWISQHHAMVITGYDYVNGTVTVADPLKSSGFATYSMSKFERIYNAKGMQSMLIEKIPETTVATTAVTTTTTKVTTTTAEDTTKVTTTDTTKATTKATTVTTTTESTTTVLETTTAEETTTVEETTVPTDSFTESVEIDTIN